MKKILLFLSLIVLIVLVGCSNQAEGTQKENNKGSEEDNDDNFPEKPIEVIIPYPPGGNSDTTSRIIIDAASEYLPNEGRFDIINVEGGASSTGITKAAQSEPDGYTITQSTAGGIVTVPILNDVAYNLDDFDPITGAVTIPQMLVVRSDSPWQDFDEWLDYVKENPNDFQYANNGVGNVQHIQMETLEDAADIETTIIPFEGGAASAAAMIGGNADAVITFPGT